MNVKNVSCEKAGSLEAVPLSLPWISDPRFPVSHKTLNRSSGIRLKYPYMWREKEREFNSDAGRTLEVTEHLFLPFAKEEKAVKEVMNV